MLRLRQSFETVFNIWELKNGNRPYSEMNIAVLPTLYIHNKYRTYFSTNIQRNFVYSSKPFKGILNKVNRLNSRPHALLEILVHQQWPLVYIFQVQSKWITFRSFYDCFGITGTICDRTSSLFQN